MIEEQISEIKRVDKFFYIERFVWNLRIERKLTNSDFIVYCNFCEMANQKNDNTCWPSISNISEKLGYSESGIRDSIRKLIKLMLITKEIRKLGSENINNLYRVLTFDEYKELVVCSSTGGPVRTTPTPCTQKGYNNNNITIANNVSTLHYDTLLEKPQISNQPDEANKILEVFYKINPLIGFSNRTQRSSSSRLIKKLGLEKAIASAEAAIAVHGKPYAPTITTPLQLENKFSELVAFYKKNESKKVRSL